MRKKDTLKGEYNLTVETSDAGTRLDLYLTLNLPIFSRSFLKNMISSERVKVNDKLEFHPQYKVRAGDRIHLEASDSKIKKDDIIPTAMRLDIVYEDEQVLAINKPAGLIVHPSAGHHDDTLANGVKSYLQKKKRDSWDSARVGLVHRLDGPTSGVIIFAKTPHSLWLLSQLFAQHRVHKTYLALVQGSFPEQLSANTPIGRDRFDPDKFSSDSRAGRPAVTDFSLRAVSTDQKYSLVQAEPRTGRTHQIRVHLAEAGYPIVGDLKYRGAKAERLMLHAYRLGLPGEKGHPDLEIVAPPPKDFTTILQQATVPLDVI